MKAKLFSALVLTGLALVAQQSFAAPDGTITFKGIVLDTTCTINGGGTAADFTVTLPQVNKTQLSTAGAIAGKTPFVLQLTNCPTFATKVHAFFEGVSVTNGRLNNSATNGAANVQIQLLKTDGTNQINVNDNAQSYDYANPSSGNATLTYNAQYYANGAAAGAGQVTATATYTLIYE
ncbi:fimbrial protein [Ramlibacter monticola]|uniref:Type 1 fimbrial protein n=1 Tax=Ramlibacter monticola TaxID=1926872 RepID=A0A936Z625_9BURK|nr:fimbrial protein [Ramlibacter monticola]MBL0394454.1 type 1 fimbrial protein [Ramlibacter monticola]